MTTMMIMNRDAKLKLTLKYDGKPKIKVSRANVLLANNQRRSTNEECEWLKCSDYELPATWIDMNGAELSRRRSHQ